MIWGGARTTVFFLGCIFFGWIPAHAVILGKPDGSANTTAPADDPGWDRVGTVNGSSGVYLGEGYVLSAKHVNAGDFTLGSTTYSIDSTYTPQYFETQPGMFADLVIYKILSAPSMSLLPIYTASSEIGQTGTFIGFGLDRGDEVSGQGWLWGSPNTKRWGQNVIDTTLTLSDPGVQLHYEALITDFDRVGGLGTGLAEESHGAYGDSGGALFIKQGSTWKLAGIMTAVTENGRSFYDNDTILPGDQSDQLASVRLSAYSGWILATIPEPKTGALIVLGVAAILIRFLRRK
jgi:trypsin